MALRRPCCRYRVLTSLTIDTLHTPNGVPAGRTRAQCVYDLSPLFLRLLCRYRSATPRYRRLTQQRTLKNSAMQRPPPRLVGTGAGGGVIDSWDQRACRGGGTAVESVSRSSSAWSVVQCRKSDPVLSSRAALCLVTCRIDV